MAKKLSSFRVGRVRAFLRGQVWYLAYFEQGQRRQPRVGPDQQPRAHHNAVGVNRLAATAIALPGADGAEETVFGEDPHSG